MQTALALTAVASALVAAGAWVAPSDRRPRAAAGRLLLACSALVWAVVAAAQGQLHLIGTRRRAGACARRRPARAPATARSARARAARPSRRPRRHGFSPIPPRPWRPRRSGGSSWPQPVGPCSAGPSTGPARLYYDPLTGLANEELLTRRVALALAACRESGKALTLVRLELRGVDAAAGGPLTEQALDELRVAVAHLRSGSQRGHRGPARRRALRGAGRGPRGSRAGGPAGRARLLALRDPFVIDGRVLALRADTELAVGFGDGESAAELVAGACALPGERIALEAELRIALTGGELSLAYQPVFDLRAGGVEAVEALLRWQHPQRGELAAAEFLPAAESSDLILEIGDWVLAEACTQWRRWLDSVQDGGGSGSA